MGTARADSVAIYSMKHMEQICFILVLKGTDYDSDAAKWQGGSKPISQ